MGVTVLMAARLLLLGVAITVVVGVGVGSVPGAEAAITAPLPDDTLLYDRTGTVLLADVHPSGYQHYGRSLSQLGGYLPQATVAIEDHALPVQLSGRPPPVHADPVTGG